MKVYAVVEPACAAAGDVTKPKYKNVLILGSWSKQPCPKHGSPHSELMPPLVVEWTADRRQAGDVAWGYAGYDFICSSRVKSKLLKLGRQFRFEKVTFKKARASLQSLAAQRANAYEWPIPRSRVSIDVGRNKLRRKPICEACGLEAYVFKIEGLLFEKAAVGSAEVFTVPQLGNHSPVFVTETYMEKLSRLDIDNIGFSRSGKIG